MCIGLFYIQQCQSGTISDIIVMHSALHHNLKNTCSVLFKMIAYGFNSAVCYGLLYSGNTWLNGGVRQTLSRADTSSFSVWQ